MGAVELQTENRQQTTENRKPPTMRLIVGLGNPGREYAQTRHNLGFRVVEVLAARWGVPLNRKTFEAQWGQGEAEGTAVVLARPTTYMNLSGRAVLKLLKHWRLSPESLVVIHDDLDVPFGRLKIVERGSAAGHRGVLSIQAALGAEEFLRVKLGIGRPEPGVDPEKFVLGRFHPDEVEEINGLVERAAAAVAVLLSEGLAAARNKFHGTTANTDL